MEKKFIESMGIQLAYVEQNPFAKESIIFIHGNSGSSWLWEKQFNDSLFSEYRLIAFDLPAHGQSSASNDPEMDYSVTGLSKIMAGAVRKLVPNSPFILVGFSLGTNIVVEMLDFSITPLGMVLSGPDLIGGKYALQDAIIPDVDTTLLFKDNTPVETVKRYTGLATSSKDQSDTDLIIADYNSVKTPFRSTLLKTAIAGTYGDEISILNKSTISTLFVYGEDEKLLNTDYLKGADLPIWGNNIFKIPDAGHFVNMDQPRAFNDLLFKYSDQIFTADHSG